MTPQCCLARWARRATTADCLCGTTTECYGWLHIASDCSPPQVELADLPGNLSYRFRLIARNGAGRSHPGTPSAPVHVCVASSADQEGAQGWGGAVGWFSWLRGTGQALVHATSGWHAIGGGGHMAAEEQLSPSPAPLALPPLLLLLAICLSCCRSLYRTICPSTAERRRRAERGRYQAASTAAPDEDDDGDEAPLAATGAWNRMEALLCVHVFVPDSRAPVKVSPTDGLHDCY